jgi:hypothetical protein
VTRVLLLPSPLVPQLVHVPFLEVLEEALAPAGRAECSVAAFPHPAADAAAVLRAFRHRVEAEAPDLVLTHSNGGRYAALAAPGVPTVHVDAALPPESGAPATMAPTEMLERLGGMAGDDGLLSPWSRWWPEEVFTAVLPDPTAREVMRGHEHAMPLAYFHSRLGAPPGWTGEPQAYLAFGDTYADEVALAGRHGWPVIRMDGAGHLHHLVAPRQVADAVLELAARL